MSIHAEGTIFSHHRNPKDGIHRIMEMRGCPDIVINCCSHRLLLIVVVIDPGLITIDPHKQITF